MSSNFVIVFLTLVLASKAWVQRGAILGASWAVLERRADEKARTLKSFKQLAKISDFGILGPSHEESLGSLGTSWRLLGLS